MTLACSEQTYQLLAQKYHWTFEYCQSLNPYWLLIALGWTPKAVPVKDTRKRRARRQAKQHLAAMRETNAPRPPYYPAHLPWPPPRLNS